MLGTLELSAHHTPLCCDNKKCLQILPDVHWRENRLQVGMPDLMVLAVIDNCCSDPLFHYNLQSCDFSVIPVFTIAVF